MNADHELKTTLTADGSPLAQAMRDAERDVQAYTASVSKSGATAAGAAQQASAAVNSQAAATRAASSAATAHVGATGQAEAATKKLGVSAGQTAAAMRMLPAQITDITTSLASGMPLWTVAIQQGGQIKDSFGGIGPTLTALRAAITPTMAAVGGVGTAVAIAAIAYAKGAAESEAYTRAIIMSGNAAGTTVSRLTEMAKALGEVTGSQAGAAEVLSQLTATGQVANSNLQAFAGTAVAMQRVIGTSTEETVKNFEELGRKPLEASKKLHESYGYLTAATYDRIKALEKQGKLDEAGEVAQQAYSKAMDERAKLIQANAGTITRAWQDIEKWAAKAWNAMLGIGRKNTTQEELNLVGEQLAALDSRKSNNPDQTQQRRAALQQRQAELQEQLRFESRSAQSQAAERAATDKHIRDSEEADKKRSSMEAAARQEAEARTRASVERIKSELEGLTGAYGDAERQLDAQRAAGLVSESEYWAAKRAFIGLNADAQERALQAENAVLAQQKATGAEKIRLDAEIAKNTAEMARTRAKAAADVAIANAQEAAGYEKLQRAQQEYQRQLDETLASRERQQGRDLAVFGRGDAARSLAGRQNAVDDRVLQMRSQLDGDKLAGRLREPEYQGRLQALEAYHEQALQQEETYQQQLQKLQGDGTLGMQRALENYRDNARNVAQQTENLFTNAFQGMEDAIVQFAMTGKASFSDFARSVIADLMRIYIRQQLTGLVGSFMGMFGGGAAPGVGTVNGSAGSTFIPSNVAHGGGVIGADSFQQRWMPASTWDNAPRFHRGLAADEYAAILQRGESVFTPEQMRKLQPAGAGGAAVNLAVNVYNNNAGQSQVRTQQRPDGNLDVFVDAVESTMADRVSAGQGPLHGAISGRFGLRPAMV